MCGCSGLIPVRLRPGRRTPLVPATPLSAVGVLGCFGRAGAACGAAAGTVGGAETGFEEEADEETEEGAGPVKAEAVATEVDVGLGCGAGLGTAAAAAGASAAGFEDGVEAEELAALTVAPEDADTAAGGDESGAAAATASGLACGGGVGAAEAIALGLAAAFGADSTVSGAVRFFGKAADLGATLPLAAAVFARFFKLTITGAARVDEGGATLGGAPKASGEETGEERRSLRDESAVRSTTGDSGAAAAAFGFALPLGGSVGGALRGVFLRSWKSSLSEPEPTRGPCCCCCGGGVLDGGVDSR